MSRRRTISMAGSEPDSLRWIITTAFYVLAIIAIVGMLFALACISIRSGDDWGAFTYGGIAALIVAVAVRNL